MTPQQVFEKLKGEHARGLRKHGKWKGNYTDHEQSEAIRDEFAEWYAAYVISDINGEHGEMVELLHLMNVAMRRIMFLSGEDQ